jgi:hypothetical protein
VWQKTNKGELIMNNNNNNNSHWGGIGFTGLLTIVFIVLKLCNVINWSWWWVLAPLWIDLLLALLIVAIFFVITVCISYKESRDFEIRLKGKDKWKF